MTRKSAILNNIIIYGLTLASFVLVAIVGQRYASSFWKLVLLLVAGAILGAIIVSFFHELGHLIVGKKNGFAFISMSVLFFKWTKVKNRVKFSFSGIGNQIGYTEMVSKTSDNLKKRFSRMTLGGIYFSIIPLIIGIVPIFLTFLPLWAYSLWVMLTPVALFSILDNGLAQVSDGVRNDGAIVKELKMDTDASKVLVNINTIQAEMYQGKTPSQVDESLYFDLPQLPEDDLLFFLLLNARYNYYLDKGDFDNAKKTIQRMLLLEEYVPKEYMLVAKADALYNACTFNLNEELADDLTYELEKYLNKVNNLTNLRIKLAYILFIKGEKDSFDIFYNKALKEVRRGQIKGYNKYELKLIDKMKGSLDI